MKRLGLLPILACAGILHGCANTQLPSIPVPSLGNLPFVYRMDVQQGNIVTQDMLAQLSAGMNKKKVTFIMGSPIIQDTFHADRWDYVYTISHDGGNRAKRRRVTLFFKDNLLARVEGDVTPAPGLLTVDMHQDTTVDVPNKPPGGIVNKIKRVIPFVGKDAGAQKATPTVAEDDAPPSEPDATPTQTMTPTERAALEEAHADGVFSKLKSALPFTGEGSATVSSTIVAAPPETAEKPTKETTEGSGDTGLMTLAKFKALLPFKGGDKKSSDDASPPKTTADGTGPIAADNGGNGAATPDPSAHPREGEKTVEVPTTPPAKPGFFARLFSRENNAPSSVGNQ